jgi:hypothetical protein
VDQRVVVGPGSGRLPGTGGSAGAEIGADVGCMGRAFLCLALRELEEGPGPSQPTLESGGGVFEAVTSSSRLVVVVVVVVD